MKRGEVMIVGGMSLILVLSGCATDPLASEYSSNSGSFVSSDGAVRTVPTSERGDPIDFAGITEDGAKFSSTDFRGKVLVVNFWYAGCAPCRAEAPILKSVEKQFGAEEVQFVGVNSTDQAATVTSFDATFGISYPTVMDVNSGAAQIAFNGKVPPTATPTTIILDARGRIASRIVGQIESASLLEGLIKAVTPN